MFVGPWNPGIEVTSKRCSSKMSYFAVDVKQCVYHWDLIGVSDLNSKAINQT